MATSLPVPVLSSLLGNTFLKRLLRDMKVSPGHDNVLKKLHMQKSRKIDFFDRKRVLLEIDFFAFFWVSELKVLALIFT